MGCCVGVPSVDCADCGTHKGPKTRCPTCKVIMCNACSVRAEGECLWCSMDRAAAAAQNSGEPAV